MRPYAVMGKAEGSVAREEWHGHVTALSVAPEFRRLGLAAKLMEMLEEISERFERPSIEGKHASCDEVRHFTTLSRPAGRVDSLWISLSECPIRWR